MKLIYPSGDVIWGEAQAHWTCAGYGDTICGCGSVGRASDCHSEGRGFEPRQPLHVAVVQLVEHQIVALVVVDSSSTGHPILDRHSKLLLTKTLILGLRMLMFYLSRLKKLIQEETEMVEILALENRIALLQGRTGRENGKIIKKLQRRLRRLQTA